MAWQAFEEMTLRLEFVTLASAPDAQIAELCRRFGISRKTGHKWLGRHREHGENGLLDRSRRPKRSPGRTDADLEEAVVAVRKAHPSWGGRKIRQVLAAQNSEKLPAASTITGILRRHGLMDNRQPSVQPFKRFEAEAPNRLWQMDFKGHFSLEGRTDGGGQRCWPLTVLDDHSRYNLAAQACADERETTVKERLTAVFERYGLPEAIITDNGSPWGNVNATGHFTQFSVWLLKLGVKPLHSRPKHPQTMGKIERMHRSMKIELLQGRRFIDLESAQEGLDRWRETYNHHRPHEALAGQPPASRYRMSNRAMPSKPIEPEYHDHEFVGRVRQNGCLHLPKAAAGRSADLQLSQAFAGQQVALRATERDGCFHVCFANYRIADVDFSTDPAMPSVTHVLVRL